MANDWLCTVKKKRKQKKKKNRHAFQRIYRCKSREGYRQQQGGKANAENTVQPLPVSLGS